MHLSLSFIALSGLASAILSHPQGLMTRSQIPPPSLNFKRDLLDRDTAPCMVLSEAYKAANVTKGLPTVIDVPPSVGISCLKSVPVDKERDIALVEWLIPYVEFHTTIDVLANPPDEYLSAGVDVLGGLKKIKATIQKNGYDSQYDVMSDIRAVFVASHDNHFHYFSPIFNIFDYVRPDMQFVSISKDGLQKPEIFMKLDVARDIEGHLDYFPSPVSSVDDTPVNKWLQNNAEKTIASCQDPDALFNSQLFGLPRLLNGRGDITSTEFEIPDKHVIKFRNGSKIDLTNRVRIYATSEFSNITSGEDVHRAFELPVDTTKTEKLKPRATHTTSSGTAIPTSETVRWYPYPVVKGPLDSISGYFLNDTGYKDVAVLSILNFEPISKPDDFDGVEWALENMGIVSAFLKKARKDKREKLVIDLSGNGGGLVILANAIYRILFPDGKFDAYGRYRATPFFKVASEVAYGTLVDNLYQDGPFNTEGKNITSPKKWFGPYKAKGNQNVTSATFDKSYNYFEPLANKYFSSLKEDSPFMKKALFKPENILIVTDGICGSACTILTGLLTRNYGVRTLALGGRPAYQAMQAMGGVKGVLQLPKSTLMDYESIIRESLEDDHKGYTIYNASASQFPGERPPLRETSIGIAVNGLNSYQGNDVDGYPVHFKYQAANCRLFYTQNMAAKMPAAWKRAAGVAWKGEKCVSGSSTGKGNTIGDELVPFKRSVRSQAQPVINPGSL